MFKLSGFGDEIAPDLEEQLNVLESESIHAIELRGVYSKGVLYLTPEETKEIKKQLKDRGFIVSAIASPIGKINITDDFNKHLELFKKALELAHFFETPYIRLFSYYIPKNEKPTLYRGEVIKRTTEKVKLAEKEKVILMHENEREIYGNTSERCLDLIKEINSPYFKVLFDPGNFVIEGEKPFEESFPKLRDYIVYLHIKDATFSGEIKVSGEGDAEIKKILIALKERNFEGFLSLEPHLTMADKKSGFSGAENFKMAAQALRKLIEEVEKGKPR